MFVAALAMLGGAAGSVFAAEPHKFQFSDWWLPAQFSQHGDAMDSLFILIFAITSIVLVLVQGALVFFLIKYRHNPNRKKAHFIHGNPRLEVFWTVVPAVILAAVSLLGIRVWGNYRYNDLPAGERAQILVVGEQFKWNVIYPGADGKIGRYLRYPKPSDPNYRTLAFKDAVRKINNYINDDNPLGKDNTDPDGKDDDWVPTPSRPVIVPVNKPIEVLLGSKDVLHDFFLPNFRVKLDALPGMLGHIYFQAKPESQCTHEVPIEQVDLKQLLWVDRGTKNAGPDADGVWGLADPKDANSRVATLGFLESMVKARLAARKIAAPTGEQIRLEGEVLRADLKAAGVNTLWTMSPFEIVCEELCGMGHGTMKGTLIVVSQEQYRNFIYKNAPPSTQPTRTLAALDATPANR
jgi:cytochrome c oxidase subunit 2